MTVLRIVPRLETLVRQEMSFAELFEQAERELRASQKSQSEALPRYVVWYRFDAGTGLFRSFIKGSDGSPRLHTLQDARDAVITLQHDLGIFAWMKKKL